MLSQIRPEFDKMKNILNNVSTVLWKVEEESNQISESINKYQDNVRRGKYFLQSSKSVSYKNPLILKEGGRQEDQVLLIRIVIGHLLSFLKNI